MAEFDVGDRVLIHGKLSGTVSFVGSTKFAEGTWVGVTLDRPLGKNNGSIRGEEYFQCEEHYGLFVRMKTLSAYDEETHAVNRIQTIARGRLARKRTRERRNVKAWNIMDNHYEDLHVKKGRKVLDAAFGLASKGSDRYEGKEDNDDKNRGKILHRKRFKNIESTLVEKSYKGVHVGLNLELETVLKLLEQFKAGIPLHFKYVVRIVDRFRQESAKFPCVQRVTIPENSTLTVIGDLHGQLQDLYTIFTINGLPDEKNCYLFNGDFVDRGQCGVEIALILFCFKMLYPDSVYLNRGNHESRAQNSWMGFEDEVFGKYHSENDFARARTLYNMFGTCFDHLPLVTIISEKVFVCHGGLFHVDGVMVEHLDAIRRKREPPIGGKSLEDRLFEDILWSDPRPSATYPDKLTGCVPSARGAGVEFGPDVTEKFCAQNGFALVIRSHECVPEGYEIQHNGRLITVFSASRYCGTQTNKGAFITFNSDVQPEIQQYYAHSLDVNSFGNDREHVRQQLLEDDLVRMIIERVCDKKTDLYWYFTRQDKEHNGLCTRSEWAHTMRTVLNLELPYLSLQHLICDADEVNGNINYSDFLERYRFQMSTGDYKWVDKIMKRVNHKLFSLCGNIEEAFALFDVDDDGLIEYDEFLKTFQSLDVGLTDKQAYELMRSIDTDNNGVIDFKEFCERFQIVFDKVRITSDGNPLEGVSTDAHENLSRILSQKDKEANTLESKIESKSNNDVNKRQRRSSSISDDAWVQQKLHHIGVLLFKHNYRLDEAFAKFDVDSSGEISKEEFIEALGGLGLTLSNEDALRIFAAIDHANSQQISYLEFVNAFNVDDTGMINKNMINRSSWQDSIIQMVANVLFQHRVQLLSAFRLFDLGNSGEISGDDFKTAMLTVNVLFPEPLSNAQISELKDALINSKSGKIDYRDFLESFQIVDVGWTNSVESSSLSREKRRRDSGYYNKK